MPGRGERLLARLRRPLLARLQIISSSAARPDTDTAALAAGLRSAGAVRQGGLSLREARTLIAGLGEVIQSTDVTVRSGSRALVTSARGLEPHTDHHRADIVAWYCIRQSSQGGESLLVDSRDVLASFTEAEKRVLETVYLREHRVFEGDPERHPLLKRASGRGRHRCYYSFWLVEQDLDAQRRHLLERFHDRVRQAERRQFRLRPGELLLIDNGRMLHGRTPIGGDQQRLLKRFWIARRTRRAGATEPAQPAA